MSENSEILSEAARLIRLWAGARGPSDSVKLLIRRAARRLGWSYGRAKAVWYAEAKRIDAKEMDALRKREKSADEVYSALTALVGEALSLLRRTQLDRGGDRSRQPMADAEDRAVAKARSRFG